MAKGDLCVTRVPIFQGLTHQQQLHVAEFIRPLSVRRGEPVYTPGDSVSRLLVVHSGQLKVSHLAANGQEQVLRTVTEGDVVGERAFLSGHRPNDLVLALEDSQMCVFNHADLSTLIRDYPDISQRMLQTLSDRLASVERQLVAITSSDVTARVAAYLLDLTSTGRGGIPTVRLPMAKKEIATYLGTTPETLSRRLAELSASGTIQLQGRRDVLVLDLDALERLAMPQ